MKKRATHSAVQRFVRYRATHLLGGSKNTSRMKPVMGCLPSAQAALLIRALARRSQKIAGIVAFSYGILNPATASWTAWRHGSLIVAKLSLAEKHPYQRLPMIRSPTAARRHNCLPLQGFVSANRYRSTWHSGFQRIREES